MYMILFLIFFLSGGLPVLIPLGFLNILSRYISNRSLLQSNSTKIDGLGEDFMEVSFTLLPIIIVICPIFGEWMLSANTSVYNVALSTQPLRTQLPILSGIFPELTRQLYLPWFLILSIVAAGEFFLHKTLVKFCSCLCSLCYDRKQVVHPYHTRPFAEYAKGMNVVVSYNIRNND